MHGQRGAGRGRMTVVRGVVGAAAIAVILLLTPVAAQAQGVKFGLRAGFDIDPDAVVFGGHVMIPNVIKDQPFVIVPNVEIGFGSEGPFDYTIFKLNGDTRWEFPVGQSASTRLYPLAGLSIYRIDLQDCVSSPVIQVDCANTEFGLNIGGGVRYKAFAVELKIGLGDIQDFHIGGSYTFGLN